MLGIAAFAVAPAAARAEGPHWYRNGIPLPAGFPVKVELVGTLSIKDEVNTSGEGLVPRYSIKCAAAGLETLENPVGGGPGIDKMTSLAFTVCASKKACPAGVQVEAAAGALPWNSEIVDEVPPVYDESYPLFRHILRWRSP